MKEATQEVEEEVEVEYSDVVTLGYYMAEHGYTAYEVASMTEKPWHYGDLLTEALMEQLS